MVSISQGCPPRSGINWSELRRAYGTFLADPAQSILHILAAGRHSRWHHKVMARLRRQAAPIVHRHVMVDLYQLSQLSPESLGGAYARHMLAQGFTVDSFIAPEIEDPFNRRLAIAHDVQHIMMGFDSSPIGEFGLAACMLVQYRDLLNVFVLSWVPWFMLGNPRDIPRLWQALTRGLRQGWSSRPLAAYPFEDNWAKPIWEVRQDLHIGPCTLKSGVPS